jgi:hypothetical protein
VTLEQQFSFGTLTIKQQNLFQDVNIISTFVVQLPQVETPTARPVSFHKHEFLFEKKKILGIPLRCGINRDSAASLYLFSTMINDHFGDDYPTTLNVKTLRKP